jgi:hypothetical protein
MLHAPNTVYAYSKACRRQVAEASHRPAENKKPPEGGLTLTHLTAVDTATRF